jgi:hypothetical protein
MAGPRNTLDTSLTVRICPATAGLLDDIAKRLDITRPEAARKILSAAMILLVDDEAQTEPARERLALREVARAASLSHAQAKRGELCPFTQEILGRALATFQAIVEDREALRRTIIRHAGLDRDVAQEKRDERERDRRVSGPAPGTPMPWHEPPAPVREDRPPPPATVPPSAQESKPALSPEDAEAARRMIEEMHRQTERNHALPDPDDAPLD